MPGTVVDEHARGAVSTTSLSMRLRGASTTMVLCMTGSQCWSWTSRSMRRGFLQERDPQGTGPTGLTASLLTAEY
jgi:hypothetical protein